MNARILRYSDVEILLGVNRVTIWRRVKTDPTFPRPIRLGSARNCALGFLQSEIDAWIEQQAATARVPR
ncbi:AlpA family phage regulatory protein [Achromobacter deleyi]|uniref:helix-turn-helix transcriptional regulator n=1 Tax=Achromobacter deleyi TaxID=1353891 RepID=UPI00286D1423|nr:AlpA family phage regulatory protein [Achromobacter deleyi]